MVRWGPISTPPKQEEGQEQRTCWITQEEEAADLLGLAPYHNLYHLLPLLPGPTVHYLRHHHHKEPTPSTTSLKKNHHHPSGTLTKEAEIPKTSQETR